MKVRESRFRKLDKIYWKLPSRFMTSSGGAAVESRMVGKLKVQECSDLSQWNMKKGDSDVRYRWDDNSHLLTLENSNQGNQWGQGFVSNSLAVLLFPGSHCSILLTNQGTSVLSSPSMFVSKSAGVVPGAILADSQCVWCLSMQLTVGFEPSGSQLPSVEKRLGQMSTKPNELR